MMVRSTLRRGIGPQRQPKVSLYLHVLLPSLSSAWRLVHSFTIDGKPEAYFRGRKLKGQEVKVPQGYRGVIVKEVGKEKTAFQKSEDEGYEKAGEGGREEEQEDTTVLNEIGSFDNLFLWNHEGMIIEDDALVKGLSEWIGFAEAVSHAFPTHRQRHVHDRC